MNRLNPLSPARSAAARIALVGDHDPSVTAHRAIPVALALAGAYLRHAIDVEWLPTERIPADVDAAAALLDGVDGVWCVPASPYRHTDGALAAIRVARERGRAFLGTCGGFQHAVLEYARSVLGRTAASHAELEPEDDDAVITPLACALVEAGETVHLVPGSQLATAYGRLTADEEYHCRYGLNPAVREAITARGFRVAATGAGGEIRARELSDHPFFVATLFQPERAALRNQVPPLVAAFVRAATEVRTQGVGA